jgi:microcystin-dependent protein
VLVSQHNPAMQDIAQSLTNSLDRDGKGGMRADLPMGNNKITGLSPGVDDTDAATMGQLTAGVGVPIGAVIDFWGTTPPEGFLFAAGQEISRETYSTLFAIIGTAGGVGNGSTTFNLPDYRGRVAAGKDDMGGTSAARLNTIASTTLGTAGGLQTHTLTTAQLAAHSHTVTDPGHNHSTWGLETGGGDGGSGAAFASPIGTGEATTGITIANAGSGDAHNIIRFV